MSVNEYALKLTQLDKYVPTMIAYFRERISKFVSGISNLVARECRTMLIKEMDISCLMIHSQKIKKKNFKKMERESKRATTSDDDFSHSRSGGHGCRQFWKKYLGQGSSKICP